MCALRRLERPGEGAILEGAMFRLFVEQDTPDTAEGDPCRGRNR